MENTPADRRPLRPATSGCTHDRTVEECLTCHLSHPTEHAEPPRTTPPWGTYWGENGSCPLCEQRAARTRGVRDTLRQLRYVLTGS